jgi:hypothetical protein
MNLKPYFDAAQAANAEVLRIANDIDAAFTLGTAEGIEQAMGMRASLEGAQTKATEAEAMYQAMKNAAESGERGQAARFVPVNESAKTTAEGKKITRAEYEALDYQARHDFAVSGGTIVDNPA